MYAKAGRPEAASIGRYHWDTWVAFSQQEASHGSLGAVLGDARGDRQAISRVTAKQGEYGAYEYGARYGQREDCSPHFDYTLPQGYTLRFEVSNFREFLGLIKQSANGVVPSGFRVTGAGNAPWHQRPEVNQERLAELARQYAISEEGSEGGG